ncbi:MAG: hypothetical protein ACOCXH_14525, partial [Cyclobacteriaceae bacterium]
DIQYELENWTYSTLEKSVQTELNESLLSLMAGCTGIAYNAIYANEWEEKIRILIAIGQQKPLWEKVNEITHLEFPDIYTISEESTAPIA